MVELTIQRFNIEMNIMKKREENNKLILDALTVYLQKYPDMRFGQALINMGIVDVNEGKISEPQLWNEESSSTLKRLKIKDDTQNVSMSVKEYEYAEIKDVCEDNTQDNGLIQTSNDYAYSPTIVRANPIPREYDNYRRIGYNDIALVNAIFTFATNRDTGDNPFKTKGKEYDYNYIKVALCDQCPMEDELGMDAYYLSLKTEDAEGNLSDFSIDNISDLQKIIDAITRGLDAISDPIAKKQVEYAKRHS